MQLFTFKKIYTNDDLLTEYNQIQDISTINLENEWLRYWNEFGDDIITTSWYSLYKNYIVEDTQQNKTLSDCSKELECINAVTSDDTNNRELVPLAQKKETLESTKNSNNQSTNTDNLLETTLKLNELNIENSTLDTDWNFVWEDHYQEKYQFYFNLFYEIYKIAQDQFVLKEEIVSSDSFSEDSDDYSKLKSLGLPTSFKSSKPCIYKKIKENNQPFWLDDIESNKNIERIDSAQNLKMNSELNENEVKPFKIVKTIKTRKKKMRMRYLTPSCIKEDKSMYKYWQKRFLLFSKFDQGILLDKESWFSVTPEKIAINIANNLEKYDIVIDAFCGCGGNTIQLAKKSKKVIAIDIDPSKIQMAKHNAKIYQVDNKIEFIVGDFLQLCDTLKGDAIFLSPPWGGPNYAQKTVYDIDKDLLPINASELFEKCRVFTNNICIYLPKNSDKKQIIKLAKLKQQVKIEQNYLNNNLVALTAYFGDLI